MNNEDVAQNWIDGKRAANGRGNFTTDGVLLFSYDMLIGVTLEDGQKVVLNCSSPFVSTVTTARHASEAGYAIRKAERASGIKIGYEVNPARRSESTRLHWDGYRYPIYLYYFPVSVLRAARGIAGDPARLGLYNGGFASAALIGVANRNVTYFELDSLTSERKNKIAIRRGAVLNVEPMALVASPAVEPFTRSMLAENEDGDQWYIDPAWVDVTEL